MRASFRVWMRFTPTCVGTMNTQFPSASPLTVHPHVRGDDFLDPRILGYTSGSPPRAWGRCRARTTGNPPHRFTPTCVGTIAGEAEAKGGKSVHPHVRGDDAALSRSMIDSFGSPPRAWGRWDRQLVHRPAARFTPTCVGTIWNSAKHTPVRPVHPHVRGDDGGHHGRPAPLAVHPHVRGDDSFADPVREIAGGSPPRAWGRSERYGRPGAGGRFTPTCVGTIATGTWEAGRRSVHPHVRGDDSLWSSGASFSHGSPPRAWGRWSSRRNRAFASRFTPTCVGTIQTTLLVARLTTVHPHVRGDDVPNATPSSLIIGSPPRAWGRCDRPQLCHLGYRFTPTCVGTIN